MSNPFCFLDIFHCTFAISPISQGYGAAGDGGGPVGVQYAFSTNQFGAPSDYFVWRPRSAVCPFSANLGGDIDRSDNATGRSPKWPASTDSRFPSEELAGRIIYPATCLVFGS